MTLTTRSNFPSLLPGGKKENGKQEFKKAFKSVVGLDKGGKVGRGKKQAQRRIERRQCH